jgi:type IV pilus assembly protein PilV
VFRNEGGFTLIEFLVAIVILMIGMLGLLQSVNVALQYNTTTQMRNEAVALGDAEMSRELAKPFDLISVPTTASRRSVHIGLKNYSIARSGADMTNSRQVNIVVSWTHKRNRYTHEVCGVASKINQ